MTSSSEPFVSVLSPFHNTEAYLAECIESVLEQSYENFEYILVDNQSTDRSAEIAASYAEKDSRIRLYKTPRMFSQLSNYNFSLEQISLQSRYTKIVQADDWIFPSCLSEMVSLAEANPSVGLVGSYHLWGTEMLGTGLSPGHEVVSGRNARRLYLLDGICLFGSQTSVMYRSDIVRKRRPMYQDGRLHADTEAAFEILVGSDFGFVHQVLSFLRTDDNSITGKIRNFAPHAVDRLILIKCHGRSCMTEDEYEACLQDAVRGVYRSMAENWVNDPLRRHADGFWSHYQTGLLSADERIQSVRLAQHVAISVLKRVLNPIALVRSVMRPASIGRRGNLTGLAPSHEHKSRASDGRSRRRGG